MEIWRKKGDKYNQEFSRTTKNNNNNNNNNNNYNSSYSYKKPPIGGNSNWQQNVPYWEKRFVSTVGSLSWKKFLEAKEFTHLYNNIMKWDDCAGEEAFRTAKDRFYAQFHGLQCETDQYNPDLYIDQIDWNEEVDETLILDLYSEPVVTDVDGQHEPVVIFGDALPDPYKEYSGYGWGDSDEKVKKSSGIGDGNNGDQNAINWDDYIDNGRIIWDKCNDGGANNDSWDWNQTDNKAGDQGWNTNTYDNNNYYSSYGNGNNERHVSNQNKWCSNGNNEQRNRSWRNNGNRRSTGQGYRNHRGYGSTIQAYGSQRIHVRP